MSDSASLKEKIVALNAKDSNRRIFGARSHQYVLNPVLSKEEVEKWETDKNVKLPEDYKSYLMEVANGGAGPEYGIHKLDDALHNPWMELGPIDQPFTLEDDNTVSNYNGCIMISQRGCGGWTFLVLTGPIAGQVWYDDSVADMGFGKAADSFNEWVNGWLDRSMEKAALQTPDSNSELFERLTHLSQKSAAELAAVLEKEPVNEDVVMPLVKLAYNLIQSGIAEHALVVYKKLMKLPVPQEGSMRTVYLEGVNNAIIAGCMAKDFDSAVAISDFAQPYVQENPFIAHSAACAYMGKGDKEKALEQCRLAVKYNYPHLDMLETDGDLAPIASDPEFKKIFSK